MKKRGGEKQRTMNAPSHFRKVLTFSPPAASLAATLQKDSETPIAIEEALEISSDSLCEIASITPSSPPESILKSNISSVTCSLPSGVSSTTSNIVDSLDKVLPEEDEKKSAPAIHFLAWACATNKSEEADELSKRIAAAVLKAIEEDAAAEKPLRSEINLNSLLKMSAATLLVLICATSMILISMMLAYSMTPEPSLDFPPPT